jgi:hypothetical protein
MCVWSTLPVVARGVARFYYARSDAGLDARVGGVNKVQAHFLGVVVVGLQQSSFFQNRREC